MNQEITRLESVLDDLLPVCRRNQPPEKALTEAERAWSEAVWKAGRMSGPLQLTDQQINDGRNLVRHPVFICGVHRSGTTLLRDLLDSHPSLAVLPSEGSFLTNLGIHLAKMPRESREAFLATEWLRRLIDPIHQPPYWLMGHSTLQASPYVNFTRAFSAWYAIAENDYAAQTSFWPHFAVILAYATCSGAGRPGLSAPYWVDKTPTQERFLPKIRKELPEAKIIHIIRSPDDVFRSRKYMNPAPDLKDLLRDMKRSYTTALEQSHKDPNRYLVVRYEDLCQYPQSVMRRITGFLGMEQHPILYTPTVAGKPSMVNSSFKAELPAGNIITPQAFSDMPDLQEDEHNLLSAFLFSAASRLGYRLKVVGRLQRLLIKLKFDLHHDLFRRLASVYKMRVY